MQCSSHYGMTVEEYTRTTFCKKNVSSNDFEETSRPSNGWVLQ